MKQTISIPRTLANRLLTLAQSSPESEICGLIAKKETNQYQVYPIKNVADNNGRIFEMEHQQQITAFKQMKEQQQNLFAIFHSHPHKDATPSIKDVNEAACEDALQIIISLNTQGVLDMRGAFYRNKQVEVVDLIID